MLGSEEHLTNRGGNEAPCSKSDSGDEAYDKRREVIGNRKSSDKASSGWGRVHKTQNKVTHHTHMVSQNTN